MDFNTRLDALKKRREGPSDSYSVEAFDSITGMASNQAEVRKSDLIESLQETDGVKYAVVAMTEVDPKYTKISIREGERVASSLSASLSRDEISVDTRLQGSVGLNVHIKGYSDVDMLVIVRNPFLAELPYVRAYVDSTDSRPMSTIVGDLRARSEKILPFNYPAVTVNIAGDKSIALEGGSLQRKIDIVPAAWYETKAFQESGLEHDKSVMIYNKADRSLFINHPFSNRIKVDYADQQVGGNIKRVVRLMKTLQSDSTNDVIRNINSFDILSIAYDMRLKLYLPSYHQLGLVEILRASLYFLLENKVYRDSMWTLDMTRKVFDKETKLAGLAWLFVECTDLAESLVKEINPYSTQYNKDVLLQKILDRQI